MLLIRITISQSVIVCCVDKLTFHSNEFYFHFLLYNCYCLVQDYQAEQVLLVVYFSPLPIGWIIGVG